MIKEEDIIYKEKNKELSVSNYLYGSCHLFALVLSEVYGYEIGCTMENDGMGSDTYLVHAYCYFPENPDLIIDAGGIRDKENVLAEYPISFLETFEIGNAKDILTSWMNDKGLSNFGDDYLPTEPELSIVFENEKELIINFIKENDRFYNYEKMKKSKKLKL